MRSCYLREIARLLCGLAVAWPGVTGGAGLAADTIANPSFEELDAKGQPAGWKLWSRETGGAAMQVGETTYADGKRSLKVVCTGKPDWAVSQDAKVTAARGDAFTLSARMRADNLTTATVHVIQYTPKGERVTWTLAQLTTKGTHDWKEFKTSFRMPQDGLLNVRLMGAGVGTVWFDGLALTPRGTGAASEFATECGGYRDARQVPLLLHERAGAARQEQPVTFGMPFPKGLLAHDGNLQVLDSEGRPLPRQWQVAANWNDGSVKWATVDVQADVPPRATAKFTVDLTGKPGSQAKPLSVTCTEDTETATLGSGAIMATVSKSKFALFDSVAYDATAANRFPGSPKMLTGAPDTGFEMVMNGGKKFSTAAGPATVTIEESGAMRAVLKADGVHVGPDGAKGFDYTARISSFAGRPLLRVAYTFTNKLDPSWTNVEKAGVRLHPAFRVARVCLGGEFGANNMQELAIGPGESVALRQLDEKRCLLTHTPAQGEPRNVAGGRAAGWLTVTGEGLGLTLGVKDFWQNFPTGIIVTPDTIELELLSPLPAAAKDTPAGSPAAFAIERGAAKTYEIWLQAHPEHAFSRAPQMGLALVEPVWAALPPAWYAGCKVFGDALPADTRDFPFLEQMIDQKFEGYMRGSRLPGWVNWGDIGWQNTELDFHHGLFVAFMRTGDPKYLEWAVPMARHSTDMDVKHYDTNPEKTGGGIRHRDYFDKKEAVGTYNHTAGGTCTSHTWVRGDLDAFFLTGDRRYLDVAREIGEYLVRNTTNPKAPGGGGGRESGRMLEQLMALYAATLDEKYLAAAKQTVDFILEIQQGDGSWFSFGRDVKDRRRRWSAYDRGGHCSGVILSGLKSYHEVTEDDRVIQPFLDGVDYMMWEAMTPEQTSFLYGTTMGDLHDRTQYAITRRKEDPFTSTHMIENLAYAYNLSFNPDYYEMGMKVLKYMLEKGAILPHMFSYYGTEFLSVARAEGASLTEIPESILAVTCTPARADWKRGEMLPVKVTLNSRTDKELDVKLSLALPPGFETKQAESTVRLARNKSADIVLELAAKPDAGFGSGELAVTVEALGGTLTRKVPTVLVERRLGYIGEPDYHADVALKKMGVVTLPIVDVGAEDLSRYEVLFVGVEAHNKNSAGIRSNYRKLNDYIRAGGVALVFQLNDENWRSEFLPYPLAVSDTDSVAAKIVVADSPVFAGKHTVTDIGGMKEYDTLGGLAPEWRVLAVADDGSPAIVEARCEKGYVLVCQPSVDRYYAGTLQGPDAKRLEAYDQLFENIVNYVLGMPTK